MSAEAGGGRDGGAKPASASPPAGRAARSADEIRRDLARERERLDRHVAELQARLSPAALASSAGEAVVDKARRGGRVVVETVRRRPLSAALIAGTAGALLAVILSRRR